MTLAQRGAAVAAPQPLPSHLLRPKATRASMTPAPHSQPTNTTETEIRHSSIPAYYQPSARAHQMYTHLRVPPPPQASSQHSSVFRRNDLIYDSYGPIYNLGSNANLERYYNMLFQIDQAQRWVSPPIVVSIKYPQQYSPVKVDLENQQAMYDQYQYQQQVYHGKALEKAKVTTARRRASVQSKTSTPAPHASNEATLRKQTSRRASTSTNATENKVEDYHLPAQRRSMKAPSLKEKSTPQSLPPPKQIIHGRPFSAPATILRRIASYLDERDAILFAKSCRQLYEILDHSWWISVYCNVPKDGMGNLLISWPCSRGWCDCCEKYNSSLFVNEISKARLCSKCNELPQFQDIKISEAKQLYTLTSRPAMRLLKLLPFTMVKKSKTYWKPHVKWVHDNAHGEHLPQASVPHRQQRETTTSANSLQVVITPSRPEPPARTVYRPGETKTQPIEMKKKGIKLTNNWASKSSDSSNLTDPPTSSTIEHRSPTDAYSSASYVCTSASTEGDLQAAQAQKRRKVNDGEVDTQANGSSATDEIAREVRYKYLTIEAINAGIRMPEWGGPLGGTLLHFVNGDWDEVAKQGIGMNDFGGMINHLRQGMY